MGDTKIQWCDKVWNPVTGCTKVSEGCRNCYAERMAKRLQAMGSENYQNGFQNVTLIPATLDLPLRWKKPARIFVNSMSDLFHKNVPDEFIDYVFAVMATARQHTFVVLTKRAERMLRYLGDKGRLEMIYAHWYGAVDTPAEVEAWPLPNVWLGVSVENQKAADERIPLLLTTPAAVRFVSCEPLLGAVDLTYIQMDRWTTYNALEGCGASERPGISGQMLPNVFGNKLDWAIAGGESGPNARPMHPDWARSLRNQCQAAQVPFFFKQWGQWMPIDGSTGNKPEMLTHRGAIGVCFPRDGMTQLDPGWVPVHGVSAKHSGDVLDGHQYHEFPEVQR